MGVVGRLDQYASTLAWEFDETTANGPTITGLGTYYASEFNENIGESIVASGLVLNLDAGNLASYSGSGTTWVDLSGNTANSTLTNGPTYSSANGGSLVFDGTNDFVSVPTTSLYDFSASRVTIEVWMKIPSSPTGSGNMVVTTDQSFDTTSWSLGFSKTGEGASFVFMPSFLGSAPLSTSPRMLNSNFPVNIWTHVVATSAGNGDVGRMWVNGVKQIDGTSTTLGLPYDAGRPIGIGLEPTTGRFPFGGNISVVRIYKDKAFIESEVIQNYNALAPRYERSLLPLSSTSTTLVMTANVFAPYDLVYDEFGGTLFGAGQGRYMRQNTDKSVIVYNEIDEITDFRDIVRSGLVLDLDAGMNSSFNNTGTTWNDLSGGGNNGTLVNGPTYSSANGGSIVFDGTNDYVDVASNSSLTPTSMTLFCFLYPKNIRGEEVISCGFPSNNGGEGYRFLTRAYGGSQWQFQTSVNGNSISGSVLSNNNWYCLAVTYQSGGNIRLYLNGVQDAQVSATTALVYGTSTRIGAGVGGAQVFLQANLPVFMMYNRALSAAEIQQNYNALRNRFGL